MGIDPYGKFESLRKSSIRFGCCFDFCNSGRLRRGNAAFGETFGENFMHMVADFRCRLVGGDLACREPRPERQGRRQFSGGTCS